MAAKSRIVKWQKTREIKVNKNYNGESSPYNEWARKHTKNDEEEFREFPEANPDVLAEQDPPLENFTRKIIFRDWREIKFTAKEKQILALVARGLSQTDIAKQLKVTQSRIGHAIARIQKKAAKWYGHKTRNSSLYNAAEEETE